MTSTLASMRQLSVRAGSTTFDVAVPVGTRLGDLLGSGGFPPGARLVDASGAPLPEDDLVGEVVEDGALLYVVDAVHTPTLTRIGPAPAPRAGTPGRSAPARADGPPTPGGPVPAPTPDPRPAPSQVQIDAAAAGARTRSASRRGRGVPAGAGASGRPGVSSAPDAAPRPSDPAQGGGRHGLPDTAPGTGRRAVVPPAVRRAPGAAAGGPTGGAPGGAGLLPPPPGPTRSPVPSPPGRAVARAAGTTAGSTDAPTDARTAGDDATTGPAGGSGREPVRRGTGLGVPTPPRVAPPPTGATGRGSVATRGNHRPSDVDDDRPARPRGGPAEVGLSAGAHAVPLVLAPATVLLVLVASLGAALPTWSDWTAGAVLLVAAVVAALRPDTGSRQRWGRVAGAVTGGCGAFVLAVTLEVDLAVAAVVGFAATSALAMLGRTAGVRRGVFEPWITVTAVASGAVAVDLALAVVLSWPAYVGPLLLAGVSPLIMRALPGISLDVPEEQLIDTERLSNTSWSARSGVRRKRRPLRQATVETITVRASGVVAAGTVAIAVFVTVGYGIAVLSTMPGAVARWALLVEGVFLLGGLGLAGRTVRARFGKRVLRLTAAVVALETGWLLLDRTTGPTGDVLVVVLLVLLALFVVGVSLALDSGWRSLRLSRFADFAEGFCVVFALPAALLAVDVIAVLRQAAS